MSSLTRHLVRPTAVTLSIVFVVGTAFLASPPAAPNGRSGHLRDTRLRCRCGSLLPGRERRRHEKNDERHGGKADRRRRCGFCRDDGSAPSGCDRHGACGASPRSQPADQAVGPGDHRDPAARNCRHAPCRQSTAAAVQTFATGEAVSAADRVEIQSTHRSSHGAVT